MNFFKKVYCRLFQLCFKTAVPFLQKRNPEILNNVRNVSRVLKEKNIKNVLLVTDKNIRTLGITKNLEEDLIKNNIKLVIYDDVVANPTVENIEQALKIYYKNNSQALIAFGKSFVIDCAKAIGARIAKPKQQIKDLDGTFKIMKKTPLLIAVPTTLGTRSEVNFSATIMDFKTKHKYTIFDYFLIPKYVVLDFDVTQTLPSTAVADYGMDILISAIEAYISNSITKKSKQKILKTITLIYQNLFKLYVGTQDLKVRINMLEASYLSGCISAISGFGYSGAIAQSLNEIYNIPVGFASAAAAPCVLEAYGKEIHKKLKKLALAAGICSSRETEQEAARLFIQSIKNLSSNLGIGAKIKEINKHEIERLARFAQRKTNPFYAAPILLDKKELQKFYYDLMCE